MEIPRGGGGVGDKSIDLIGISRGVVQTKKLSMGDVDIFWNQALHWIIYNQKGKGLTEGQILQ